MSLTHEVEVGAPLSAHLAEMAEQLHEAGDMIGGEVLDEAMGQLSDYHALMDMVVTGAKYQDLYDHVRNLKEGMES